MRRDEFCGLVWCAAGPGPTRVIHVVGLGRTEHVESAEFVQRLDVLLDGRWNAVLRQQLADRAVLSLGGRPVVSPDVKHECIVRVSEMLDLVENATRLRIGMFPEPREHFHQAALKGPLFFRNTVPRRHCRVARGELGFRRYPTLRLGAFEDALAIGVPAVIELSFILICPLFGNVVRTVNRTCRPIHEERLIGLERFMLPQPVDSIVRQVFAQMVTFVWGLRRFDKGCVPNEARFPLRSFACEKAIEILEAVPGWPIVEGTGSGRLIGRGVMPLPEGRRTVPVVFEHLGYHRAAFRLDAGIAVPIIGKLRDLTGADMMMVAPCQ